MLAARAGVPVSTVSRFERGGAGSLDLFARLLFALGALDGLDETVRDNLRLALLPTDLTELVGRQTYERPKRIRVRKEHP